MNTDCKQKMLIFQGEDKRKIEIQNNAEIHSSDGGFLILHQVEKKYKIIEQLARCFDDKRDQFFVKHSLRSILTSRIFGICQGYEDLNDHDKLNKDPLLSYVCGNQQEQATPGKSTHNRLELGNEIDEDYGTRYNKITWKPELLEDFFIDIFIQNYTDWDNPVILDFDATDDPLHGKQEGAFFHGYYKHYCYLPLYVFCGNHGRCKIEKSRCRRLCRNS